LLETMGFLNKTRDPASLKTEKGGKKAVTPITNNLVTEDVKKPKTPLLNFFSKNNGHLPQTRYQQSLQQQPPPPYSPTDTNKPPVIVSQIPILNTQPPPKVVSTTTTPTDWHISDLIFLVEGKRIPSHKVVLVSRCAHFARLLRDAPAGSVTTIEIGDFSHHIFSRFVRLVYGGKKDNIAPEDAPELIRCALQYEASDIANICQEVMAEANQRLRAEQEEREREEQLLREQEERDYQLQQELQASAQQMEMEETAAAEHFLAQAHFENASFVTLEEHQQQQQQHMELQYQQHQLQQLGYHVNLPAEAHLNDNFVPASMDTFGMNVWSNDPILFNAETFEQNDGYRIMEIC